MTVPPHIVDVDDIRDAARSRRPWRVRLPAPIAALLSIMAPGGAQLVSGRLAPGLGVLSGVVVLGGLVHWRQESILFVPVGLLWLWGAYEAYHRGRGREVSALVPWLLALLVIYSLGWQITRMRPELLVTNFERVQPFFRAIVQPDIFARDEEVRTFRANLEVPCSDNPPTTPAMGEAPIALAQPTCGDIGDTVTVQLHNYWSEAEVEFFWFNPIGERQRITREGQPLRITTDEEGRGSVEVTIPRAIPITVDTGEPQLHRIEARQIRAVGSPQLSPNFRLIIEKMGETIALALMATTLSLFIAVPISFFAARNLMSANRATVIVYYVMRGVLNIFRSIEPLIIAIVFVVWVGLGSFAGVMALAVHSVAALGKLYSEAIENIDPKPIEAVTATGATRLQTIVYAVLPQVVPPYVAFTIYRWDINLRMSVIIGFVGGGGIGFLLPQWIRLSRYEPLATAFLAIIVVVAVLDYASARVREKVV